jgi:hypothetical protein
MFVTGPRPARTGRTACRALLLTLFFVVGQPAAGADKTDVVVLKNGDRITGEIRGLQNGLLTYKTDDIGILSVEWERVVRISSVWLFILEDTRGRRYTGALQEAPEPGRVVVRAGEGPVTLELADIVGIARFGTNLFQRFQGYLDLGFSLQKAQKERTLNLAAQIDYISTKWDIRTDATSYLSSQENVPNTTKNLLTLDLKRVFENRWNAAAIAQLEQNTELNLRLRLLGGLGLGRYFIRTNRHVLDGIAGVDVTRENYYDETASKTGAEGVFGLSYRTFRYVFPNMDISASAYAYPSLTTKGRVRLKFQTNVRYELFRRFYVSLGFVDNYDSKPGGETTTKNDYGLTFGISWSLN